MSHPHEHAHEHGQRPPQQHPSAQSTIDRLNVKLTDKANEIRQIEDREVYWQALSDDLGREVAGLKAVLDQMRAENMILRRRLGLPDVGAIELEDDEALGLMEEYVATAEEIEAAQAAQAASQQDSAPEGG